MFKGFLFLAVVIPIFLEFTNKIIACKWDLNPKVLLVTSYENAQEQSSEDKIIYQELCSVYGSSLVSAVFSYQDDNTYASILVKLIRKFNLKKIFILDPNFANYLPSFNFLLDSNLIRVLQQFANVDFFFFNNQIADSFKKIANNIYEFRFDTANKEKPNLTLTYGAANAEHFYKKIIKSNSEEIDTNKYNFDVDKQDGKWIIKIGLINNIGNSYQQKVIDDFCSALNNNVPKNTKYLFFTINLNIVNSYNYHNFQLVEQAASRLYQNEHVNFIFNSSYWYNNAIAHAANTTASLPNYTKTIRFIGNSILNKNDYKNQSVNYMLFSYNLNFDILKYTIDNLIPEKYQLLDDEPENFHAYGLNDELNFVDGL